MAEYKHNICVFKVRINDDNGLIFMINLSLRIINEVVKQTVWSHQFFLYLYLKAVALLIDRFHFTYLPNHVTAAE